MKKILVVLWSLYAFITGLASLLSWYKIEPKDVESSVLIIVLEALNNFLSHTGSSFLVLSFLLLIYFFREQKIMSKNFCRRISFIILFKTFNPIKSLKLMQEVHELEHLLIEQRKLLRSNASFADRNEIYFDESKNLHLEQIVGKILSQFQKIFNLFSRDISVNFKRLKKENILETYTRVPSKLETIKSKDNDKYPNFEHRTYLENFKVSNNRDISELQALAKKNKRVSFNSAYDFVLNSSNNKYWICNNLLEDEKNKIFFSSSKKYSNYYNSLAIFNVGEKLKESESKPKDNSSSMGILIFDGLNQAFNPKIAQVLGGYLAHRLYSFLSEENIHLSIHESYKKRIQVEKDIKNNFHSNVRKDKKSAIAGQFKLWNTQRG